MIINKSDHTAMKQNFENIRKTKNKKAVFGEAITLEYSPRTR